MSSAPSPRLVRSPEEFRLACHQARSQGMRVGFVPTMGALHEGHLALVREARSRTEWVAVSIFVNPTQFGPKEDLAKYPRDLEGDCAKVASAGADLVFAPEVAQMYVPGDETRVRVGALAEPLCGAFRPGHFEGVATVVTKLLALSGPCTAIFGEKDFQQLAVIRRLVADLFLPVEVVGFPIVREPDGLAMSSRNAYLSAEDRKRALCIYAGLSAARGQYQSGERRVGTLRALVVDAVKAGADAVDYITLADAKTLRPLEEGQRIVSPAVLAIACRVGTTRLIDNMTFGEDLTGSGAS